MKIFKVATLLSIGALSLALNVAGPASLWAAAAPPTAVLRPTISITPNSGTQDSTVPVTMTGTNLNVVRAGVGTGIGTDCDQTGVSIVQQTDTRVQVRLKIGRTAQPGPCNLIVTPPGATLADWVRAPFTVLQAAAAAPPAPAAREPTITSLRPNTGTVSATQRISVDAIITGTNLDAASLSMPDEGGVSATIQPGGTSVRLPIRVVIEPGVYAGNRTVRVTTSAGRAQWPFYVELPAVSTQGVPSGSIRVQLLRFRPDPIICDGLPVHFSASVNISESLRQTAADLRRYAGASYLAYRLIFDGQRAEQSDRAFAEVAAGMNSAYDLFSGGVSRSFPAGSHAVRTEVYQVNQPGQSGTGPALASSDLPLTVLDCRHQITAYSTSPAEIRQGQNLDVRVGVRNAASYTIYAGPEAGSRNLQLHHREIRPSEWVGEITETVRIPYDRLKAVLPGKMLTGTVYLTLKADHLYASPERQPVTRGAQVTLLAPPPPPPPPPAHPLAGRWSGTIRSYQSDNQQLCYEGGANLTVNADGSGTLVASNNDPNKDVSQRYATIPFTRLDGGGDTYRLSPPAPRPIILTAVVVRQNSLTFRSEWPYGIDCWYVETDYFAGIQTAQRSRTMHHRVEFILFR